MLPEILRKEGYNTTNLALYSHAGTHMAIRRVNGRAHMVGISPNLHDLINPHTAHCKIFGGPHR